MERINITRAEFEESYGLKPEPSSMGMMFCAPGGVPICEFVFTDDPIVSECPTEIAELERMYRL